MDNQYQKKILITGGTGFIGKSLCNRLLQEGYIVYILTHKKKFISKEDKDRKIYIHSLDEIKDTHIHIIINLAGETIAQRWTNVAKQRIYNSRILTTQNLVKFFNEQKVAPTLFITGSAIGYYGINNNKTFTEEYQQDENCSGFATSLCKAWEEEAFRLVSTEIRTVILRISPVLERDGGMLSKLLPSFRLCLGSQIGNGRQFLSWIDRDDLIELIIFIINTKDIYGPVNATSPNPVTNEEFSLTLAKVLHKPCILKTPEFIFKLVFGQMAEEIMLQGQKVLPQKALDHGFNFSYPKIEQSLSKIFGYT